MSQTPAISIKNLKKTYQTGVQALKGVNLEVEQGDFFALLGANGAGKTTTIGILTGLVNKSEGEIKVFGNDLDREIEKVKDCIGVVPQEFNFNIFEKVLNIVVQQAGFFGVPLKEALKRAEPVLKALELWDQRDRKSMTLSGGMKRRLMIARALLHHPKLLILDEPTAGVDVELRHGMWTYLKDLNKSGTTILLTTHYLEEVEQLCKNVAMIRDGVIVKQDSVRSALRSVQTLDYLFETDQKIDAEQLKGFKDFNLIDEHRVEAKLQQGQNLSDLILDLKKAGVEVTGVQPKTGRMEQLFLNLLNR